MLSVLRLFREMKRFPEDHLKIGTIIEISQPKK